MRLALVFAFFYINILGQTHILVKDSLTHMPIEGVHLMDGEGKILVSDIDGKIFFHSLEIKLKHSISLSHLGYESKNIIYNSDIYNSQTIFLKPIVVNLNEIILKDKRETLKYSLKDRRGINFNTGISYPEKFQVGVLIYEPKYNNLRIESIVFELMNKEINEKDSVNFNIEIWSVDSLFNPKSKININDIIIKRKFSKQIEIILDEEIFFNQQGFYIVLDFFKDIDLNSHNIVPKFKAVNIKKRYLIKEMLRYRKDNSGEFSEWFEPNYSRINKQILKTTLYLK